VNSLLLFAEETESADEKQKITNIHTKRRTP
jgi:hypothetical protein